VGEKIHLGGAGEKLGGRWAMSEFPQVSSTPNATKECKQASTNRQGVHVPPETLKGQGRRKADDTGRCVMIAI